MTTNSVRAKLPVPIGAATSSLEALVPELFLRALQSHVDAALSAPDPFVATAFRETLDRAQNAFFAKLTGGISPAGLAAAYFDWAAHLAMAPGKRLELSQKALKKALRLLLYASGSLRMTGSVERPDTPIIHFSDLRASIFAVGTETDHIAPWCSVYRFLPLTDTEVTFLLTSGGHNVGILSYPGQPNRHYRIGTKRENDVYRSPEAWAAETPRRDGSWWPELADWLRRHSGARRAATAASNAEKGFPRLCPAPGSYARCASLLMSPECGRRICP